MATVKQYALKLWATHKTVSLKLGSNVAAADLATRASALTTDVMLAGLVKVLTDNAVITDAQLSAVFDAITSASFPPLATDVTQTSDGAPLPDPNLGA